MSDVQLPIGRAVDLLDRLSRTAARGDVAGTFAVLDQLRSSVDRLELAYLEGLRSGGMTWDEIGAELEITKEGAFRRFRRRQRAVSQK